MQATQTSKNSVEARRPRRYASQNATKLENDNAPRYVLTMFRDLFVGNMSICTPTIARGVITLIESYPKYLPNYDQLIENGQIGVVEKNVQAVDQAETLVHAFGQEGLTVLKIREDEVDAAAEAIEGVELKDFASALVQVSNSSLRKEVKDQILNVIRAATKHANTVITETRREIQNSRSGKGGKNFLDDRDLNACLLLGIPEASILSLEGEASNASMDKLADKIAGALKPQAASSDGAASVELLAAIKEVSEQNKRLQAELDALKKKVK